MTSRRAEENLSHRFRDGPDAVWGKVEPVDLHWWLLPLKIHLSSSRWFFTPPHHSQVVAAHLHTPLIGHPASVP